MPATKKNPLHDIARNSGYIAIAWLVLTLYIECYWIFNQLHWTTPITDKLLFHFRDIGWLNPMGGRTIAIFLLLLSFAGPAEDKPATYSLRTSLLMAVLGTGSYYGGHLLLFRGGDPSLTFGASILETTIGFYCCFAGIRQLFRIWRPQTKADPFGRNKAGFPQQEGLVRGEFSLHLPAQYEYDGEKKQSWINILNPRRGILILGSPGCGKSRFIIEPLLRQWMQKGQVFFLYDFKYDTLTRLGWEYYGRYQSQYPPNAQFYYINFTYLNRTHRCNLIDPATLDWLADALGIARTILLSMNPSWANQQGEFFVESPINFVAAVIWWLRKYKGGQFCTLPHAIELAQLPYDKLFSLLNSEPDIQSLVNPFITAYRNKTLEMLDSQVTSAKIPLARLASPNLYYVLTGNDLTLTLNDPAAPKMLCVGGDPKRAEALTPILSLFIDRVNTLCNQPQRSPMAIICDEFATVRAYSMSTTIATGRSNNMVPILAIQDGSQLRTRYSKAEADSFLALAGNTICGPVGGETADWMVKKFPRIQRERTTTSENSTDTSVNTSHQWEPTITNATIAGLSAGEFVGLVADDPENMLDLKAFHCRLLRAPEDDAPVKTPLPIVHKVDEQTVNEVFLQVKKDVLDISEDVRRKMMDDPILAALIVRPGTGPTV